MYIKTMIVNIRDPKTYALSHNKQINNPVIKISLYLLPNVNKKLFD